MSTSSGPPQERNSGGHNVTQAKIETADSLDEATPVAGVSSPGPLQLYKKRSRCADRSYADTNLNAQPSPPSQHTTEARKKIRHREPSKEQRQCVLVLLPNSSSVQLTLAAAEPPSLEKFLSALQVEAEDRPEPSSTRTRTIDWGPNVWLEDGMGGRVTDDTALSSALRGKKVKLIMQDGHPESTHADQRMWDVTPQPEMLGRLPLGYSMETALADEVDNALQAVWDVSNQERLVSVEILPDKLCIFDTGLGMDGNTIARWGTVGSSSHRDVHSQAIGGKPPYLKPYLGKYGAGGVAAALHLGSMVTVWSKTKNSKKVVKLVLEKETLVKRYSEQPSNGGKWETEGEFRDMTEAEMKKAPDGSFTLVEITKLKKQYHCTEGTEYWKVKRVKQLLADIYFQYIHSEFGVSNAKNRHPIKFEVNGQNLVEVIDCETGISNQHTCHGGDFVIDLEFAHRIDDPSGGRTRAQTTERAHAQLTCQYFPNIKGKEEIDSVLERLSKLGLSNKTFESMPRVGVRWLGRLLPETKWGIFPFMKVTDKRRVQGWKPHWAKRVRVSVAVDAGFHPTQSKTSLERDHPFTVALENLGGPLDEIEKSSAAGVMCMMKLKGKDITLTQLLDEYMKWLQNVHEQYDQEVQFLDSPTFLFEHSNMEELGLNQDLTHLAIVFYKHMQDSKGEWNAGDARPLRIKLPRSIQGTKMKSDLYATIEWFYCQGTGDEHGEVRFICRPIEVTEEEGSRFKTTKRGVISFVLNKSRFFSVTILNSDKCLRLSDEEWVKKEEEIAKKFPAYIQILNDVESKVFECDRALPHELKAGGNLPSEFLAVIRPRQGMGSTHKQGMIFAESLDIRLRVTYMERFPPARKPRDPQPSRSSSEVPNSGADNVLCDTIVKGDHSKNGVKGLYLFESKELLLDNKLVKQGIYTFKLEVVTERFKTVRPAEHRINVEADSVTKTWTICTHIGSCAATHPETKSVCISTRLKESLADVLHLTKFDKFGNSQSFGRIPSLEVAAVSPGGQIFLKGCTINSTEISLSRDKLHLILGKHKILFTEGDLSPITPNHEACLRFLITEGKSNVGTSRDPSSTRMEQFAEIKCRVYPGKLASLSVKASQPLKSGFPLFLEDPLQPDEIIEELTVQAKDEFGNNLEKGQKIKLLLKGLTFQDKNTSMREVDEHGCLKLGGLLKVTVQYNSGGCIAFTPEKERDGKLLEIFFKVVTRSLHVIGEVPCKCVIGSSLKGIMVEVIDNDGVVDPAVDAPYHSLTLNWMKNITCPLVKGRCELPKIDLPTEPGLWVGKISHTMYKDLKCNLQVDLELGTACRLDLPASNQRSQYLETDCDSILVLKFLALDDRGQPAVLTGEMIQKLTVEICPERELMYPRSEWTVECVKIVESGNSIYPDYAAHVLTGGPIGTYIVSLRDESMMLQQQHRGSTAALSWTVRLKHGKPAQLVPVVMTESISSIVEQLGDIITHPTKSIEVARLSSFPEVNVYLLDSYKNICSDYDQQVLDLVFATEEAIDSGAIGLTKKTQRQCKIQNGVGTFPTFKLEADVGSYRVMICYRSLLSKQGSPIPAEPEFSLEVKPGNYPSALRLIDDTPLAISLSCDTQCLPKSNVVVESADRQPCKQLIPPVMTIQSEGLVSIGMKEYQGEIDDEVVGSVSNNFVFSRVYVPSQSGSYILQFWLPGYSIPSVSRQLLVRHGPPARIDVAWEQSGQKGHILQAKVLDVHGNQCMNISDLELALELAPVEDEGISCRQGVVRSCFLCSGDTAVVKNGEATFEEIQLGPGRLGTYTLTVSVAGGEGQLENMPLFEPTELMLMVTSTNLADKTQEDVRACLDKIKVVKEHISHLRTERSMVAKEIPHRKARLEQLIEKRKTIVKQQLEANDTGIISNETKQPPRTTRDVLDDMRKQAMSGNAAPWAFVQACSNGSLCPIAADAVGVVAMLARVESQALNHILCDYMGLGSLLLIVCKTQTGINALEERDRNGQPMQNRGLRAICSYKISGSYDAQALSDVRAYTGRVNRSHPQLLLEIEPPLIMCNGEKQKPPGFLGFAVNLLHLKEEHLHMKVTVRQREMGLRESLFYHLLQNLQVYDTRENMLAAKSNNCLTGGAISLDRYIIRSNMRQRLGETRHVMPVSFALVPYEERQSQQGLLPPASHSFERQRQLQSVCNLIGTQEQQLAKEERELEKTTNDIAASEKNLREEEIKERSFRAIEGRHHDLKIVSGNQNVHIYIL